MRGVDQAGARAGIGALGFEFKTHYFTVSKKRWTRLFSASQDRGYHALAAMTVYHRDNPQRLFIRCVGDQIFVYDGEAQRARG
jgi:hypothetical protein